MTERTSEPTTPTDGPSVFYMTCFLACFVSAAIVSQLYENISPTMDYSPLDYFTGGALWMASAVCLLMATTYARIHWRLVFWLTGCMALSLLAIDEFMGMHEATEKVIGDDDHSKVALWACTPIALVLVWRVEAAGRTVAAPFALGYLFQTGYIAVDVGDGDYFSLPFALSTLQWSEDIFELLFVSTFLLGFMIIVSRRASRIPEGLAGVSN